MSLKMKVVIGITCIILHVTSCNALIVPDELPSILSVIYSNIPTLKKGTDSRIGWGFRLGDRADFQVMVELGPQTNTRPLANQGGDNTNKRNAINNLANTLYAQRQQEKTNHQETEKNSSSAAGDQWLQTWSKTASSKGQDNEATLLTKAKPGIAVGEIDAKSVIPDDSVLEEMKKPKTSNPKKQVSKTIHKKTTNPNRSLISILTEGDQPTDKQINSENDKPLDDVSLD